MTVKKENLLLIACGVWCIAGANILHIGLEAYPHYVTPLNLVLSLAVFIVFQIFIFSRLVIKHTHRINAYSDQRHFFLKFFDLKSFLIMALMITAGICLRISNLASERFIAIFYTGLGTSLLLAGLLFGSNYLKARSTSLKAHRHTKQHVS